MFDRIVERLDQLEAVVDLAIDYLVGCLERVKMRRILIVVCTVAIVLIAAVVTSYGDVLVSTDGGRTFVEFKSSTLALGKPTNVQLLLIDRNRPPGDDDDDDDDVPDVPRNTVAEVQKITQELLTKKLEAQGLASVIGLLLRPGIDLNKDGESALRAAINALAGNSLFPNNRFAEWLQRVLRLNAGRPFNKDFVRAMELGVRQAFGISAVDAKVILLTATGQAQTGWINQHPETERLDLFALIELIKLIFELLRDLGIFGP